MWGQNRIRTPQTMNGYINNNPNKAVQNMKDVLTALRYMDDPAIRNRLVAQSARIEARLNLLDEIALPGWVKTSPGGAAWAQWVPIGLDDAWRPWIRGRFQSARDKAAAHINRYLPVMEARGGSAVLVNKLQILRQEWNAYSAQPFFNPLP